MKFLISFALALIIGIAAVSAQAQLLSTQQKVDDFNQLVQVIRSQYGPLEFKNEKKILNFEEHVLNFDQKIKTSATNSEFYQHMLSFVAQFHDGHFSIRIPSSHRALIPISTDWIENKVIITKIDRSKLPETQFPFSVGDEIVSVDGVLSADLIQSFKTRRGSGNPKTETRQAAWQFFRRSGMFITMPVNPTATVEIRKGQSDLVETAVLTWTMTGTPGDEAQMISRPMFLTSKPKVLGQLDMIENQPLKEFADFADVDFACNPLTRAAIPEGAEWIVKAPFSAYTYPTPKGKVGYLRLPHYYPQAKPGQTPQQAFEEWFEIYRFAVKKLEATTVGLIIDQDHNCGGSVTLVEDMTSLFMDRPFKAMQFSLRATKSLYVELQKDMTTITPETLLYENFKVIYDLVESVWKTNPGSMTDKVSISGRDWVYPDREANYTKPVVILIDEVAGSGGDAFPSGMKGEGRAKLFGQQTAGLGGSVSRLPALNNSQMQISMTNTLFFKPDGSPVENNGAIPDREYSLTVEDIKSEFKPYQKAYTEYLLEQLP